MATVSAIVATAQTNGRLGQVEKKDEAISILMQLVRTPATSLAEPLGRQNKLSLKLLLKDSTSGES